MSENRRRTEKSYNTKHIHKHTENLQSEIIFESLNRARANINTYIFGRGKIS